MGKILEAGDDKRPQELQVESDAREDRVDLHCRRAPRAPTKCGGGFFPAVFLIT
jgi:hypothetical protein